MSAIIEMHTEEEQQVLSLFAQHMAAFTSGNLDAVLKDFTEQAIVITPDGVFEGLTQIRGVYQQLLAEFGVIDRCDSPGLFVDTLYVRHNTLFVTWHAESIHHVIAFGTDTFVIDSGKVARQSISFVPPQAR